MGIVLPELCELKVRGLLNTRESCPIGEAQIGQGPGVGVGEKGGGGAKAKRLLLT